MATAAGFHENEDLDGQSDSLTQDSDEIQEMYCEDCEKELGNIVKADGFCVACLDYLCSTCLRYHKKFLPDHTIQDSANMPQDFCFQKCPNHTKEIIKFYCNSCDRAACLKCKDDNHKGCKVDHIPKLLKSTDLKRELRQTNQTIDQNLVELDNFNDFIELKKKDVSLNSENIRTSIKMHKDALKCSHISEFQNQQKKIAWRYKCSLRAHEEKKANLIAKLDQEREILNAQHLLERANIQEEQSLFEKQLEQADDKLNQEAEKLKLKEKLKLQSKLSTACKTKVDLNQVKEHLQKTVRQGQNSKVFLAVKTAMYEVDKLKLENEKSNGDTEINFYEFQPDASLSIPFRTNSISTFGTLVEKSKRKRKVSCLLPFPVTSKDDTTDTKITGLCKLSDKCLIAADNTNASVKAINIMKQDLYSTIQLKDKPFDVTKVEENEVAATLPEAGKIQFFSVTESTQLLVGPCLVVRKNCHGIVYKKPNFVVSFTPDEVQILDKNGTVLKTISNLNNPVHIALGTSNNTLYIQETCFSNTSQGSILSKRFLTKIYTDRQVMARQEIPKTCEAGFAVDKEGTIFVCSASGSNIIQISADLQTKHTLNLSHISQNRKLTCSFYCDKENKLYTGTAGGTIRVFKID